MSILQQLTTDMGLLVTESKRRNNEVRQAAEKALDVLNKVGNKGDDSNIINDLKSHAEIIDPLILSCSTRNAKFILISLRCLSYLALISAIPESKVGDTIDALFEATNSTAEIQVKILQILPGFFQGYRTVIKDDMLSTILNVCSTLQGANRQPAIAHTAQATFTQLLDTAFEKVRLEDINLLKDPSTTSIVHEVIVDDDEMIEVADCAFDAYRLISDLCTLIEHHKPSFLKTNYLSEDYGFEILESLIKNNKGLFLSHKELGFLLRTRVAPILLRFLSSSKDFSLMVRVSRLILLLIDEAFDVLKAESEVTLSLLTHLLSQNSATSNWKRVMALEIYSGLFKNVNLTRRMFLEYDNNQEEERKPIIFDILSTCLIILEDNKGILNTGELIQRAKGFDESSLESGEFQVSQRPSFERNNGLSSKNSKVSISYLESIDKSDPPPTPPTYHLLLIHQIISSLVDVIVHYTCELTGDIENRTKFVSKEELTEQKLKTYTFVTEFITSTKENLLKTFEIFLLSTLDNNLFTSSLQSLEELCSCSGVLCLQEPTYTIINCISHYALKIEGKSTYQSKVFSIGESIVDTISSTFGQAVSNISQQPPPLTEVVSKQNQLKFYSRNINSRQIYCFKSLVNLAVSLGERFNNEWRIIAISLQWISYFVDGQSGINYKDLPQFSPYLNNNDLQMIETTLENLNTGFKNSSKEMFTLFTNALINLSNEILNNKDDQFGQNPIGADDTLQPCIFNKLYAVNKINDICIIDPVKFIINSEETCAIVTSYFGELAENRNLDDEFRLLACRNLDSVIKASANSGFNYKNDDMNHSTEDCVLNSLHTFMLNLSKLPDSDELLVINCEVKMYLQNLDTLKNIIDKYGNLIKERWNIVTALLDFPFNFIEKYESTILNESAITEIIVLIIRSAFESLKVILDEVLQTIPRNQIKVIIDSLHKFVGQKFDLNISFNSVSYLWIVNDYIKENIDSSTKSSTLLGTVKTKEDLISIVSNPENSENINDYSYYCYLWLYLVLNFVTAAFDERVRVRDAAIITFFDIIETFSLETASWELIYDIILKPVILESDIVYDISDKETSKELMESSKTLVINITKLFVNKLGGTQFSQREPEYWDGLIKYFFKLLNLPYEWIELDNEIFKSYFKVISLFETGPTKSNELLISVFKFWDTVHVSHNFTNPKSFQESLISLVQCFRPSIKLFNPIMDADKFSKMQDVLFKCISYPVLDSGNDDAKCTHLQRNVLENLEELQHDYVLSQYQSIYIKLLNKIIILPLSSSKIYEDQLKSKNVKIPTYIAASHYAMRLLINKFENETSFEKLLNDGTLNEVFKSLLEVCREKNETLLIEKIESESKFHYLWMNALDSLTSTTTMITDYLLKITESDVDHLDCEKLDVIVFHMLGTLECCFNSSECVYEDPEIEKIDLLEYQKLKGAILKLFNKFDGSNQGYKIKDSQIEYYISSVWKMSFLYKEDDLLASVIPTGEVNGSVMKSLTRLVTDDNAFDNYGTTCLLGLKSRSSLAKSCLLDLSELVDPINFPNIWELGLPFLLARYALSLRKYKSDVQTLGHRPTPKVQDVELDHIVDGLSLLLSNLADNPASISEIKVLYPMLIFSLMFGRRKQDEKLGLVCSRLGSI